MGGRQVDAERPAVSLPYIPFVKAALRLSPWFRLKGKETDPAPKGRGSQVVEPQVGPETLRASQTWKANLA